MKKIIVAIVAGALLAGAAACKKSHADVDAQTAAELDQRLAGMTTYESEGKQYAEEQLKADTAYKQTATGLVYKMIAPGSGETFKPTDNVQVIYTGQHIGGEVFDSSEGKPVAFPLQNVVPGFREMITMMRPGARARCIIPGNLAYGQQGNQGIGPNETLVFDIETVGLTP